MICCFSPFPLDHSLWPWDSSFWGLQCPQLPKSLPEKKHLHFRHWKIRDAGVQQSIPPLRPCLHSYVSITRRPSWQESKFKDYLSGLPNECVLLSLRGFVRSGLTTTGPFSATPGPERSWNSFITCDDNQHCSESWWSSSFESSEVTSSSFHSTHGQGHTQTWPSRSGHSVT